MPFNKKRTTEEFIKLAKLKHGDKYDYSLSLYTNKENKVRIICPIHGEFQQAAKSHLKGLGCKFCNENIKSTNENFIKKSKIIHGNKYDYSLINYKNVREKVDIICPIHGVFKIRPTNHLSGRGCRKCGNEINFNKKRKTKEVFINEVIKVHGNKYDYSLVDYLNADTKIKIICPQHGVFEQIPNDHRIGKGCPSCVNHISKPEQEISLFLNNLNISLEKTKRNIIPPYELDIFIPEKKIAIEFNGLRWHSSEFTEKNYHATKTKLCEENNIQLIHIFEDEWNFKKNIVKSRLKNILNFTEDKIYARKCVIKEVNNKDSKIFLENNHLQGNINSSIKIGLYYKNELVALMTFGKYRKIYNSNSIEDEYELYRFCNKLNTIVIGGANKLLNYFIEKYNPKKIMTYADKRWSKGDLYEKLGFEYIGDTKPNYFYVLNNERKNRFSFRKDVLVKQGFNKNESESSIMSKRNIYKIYDCGNKKYILSLP
jgi:hypothetical protein